MDEDRLFHYTVGIRINDIVSDGLIKLETGGGLPFGKQRPAVWCTYSQVWEETCNKGLMIGNGRRKQLNKDETAKYANGLYRIEVDPKSVSHDWQSWKEQSNVSDDIAESLKNVADRNGSNIELWRASFEPIPKVKWITVESWNKKKDRWIEDAVLMWALNR